MTWTVIGGLLFFCVLIYFFNLHVSQGQQGGQPRGSAAAQARDSGGMGGEAVEVVRETCLDGGGHIEAPW